MADHVAEGVEPARSLLAARVAALALVTHLVHLAVAVLCACSWGRKGSLTSILTLWCGFCIKFGFEGGEIIEYSGRRTGGEH